MPSPAIRPAIRVLGALFAVLALLLARWQLRRDVERNIGREQALAVAGMPSVAADEPLWPTSAWRTVDWGGEFGEPVLLMAGVPRKGERGYGVLVPFTRADGVRVLVDRGWIPANTSDIQTYASLGSGRLSGQLRPMTERKNTQTIDGHGTRIVNAGDFLAAARELRLDESLYVVEGTVGGEPLFSDTPIGGFQAIPDRDNTSLHYASQWFAVAGIGLLFAFPAPLIYLRKKVSA